MNIHMQFKITNMYKSKHWYYFDTTPTTTTHPEITTEDMLNNTGEMFTHNSYDKSICKVPITRFSAYGRGKDQPCSVDDVRKLITQRVVLKFSGNNFVVLDGTDDRGIMCINNKKQISFAPWDMYAQYGVYVLGYKQHIQKGSLKLLERAHTAENADGTKLLFDRMYTRYSGHLDRSVVDECLMHVVEYAMSKAT